MLGSDITYKVVQDKVSSPTAVGSATAFIDTISQDENGVISVTKKNVNIPTPDWNAQEGEAGYIENKPFGVVFKAVNWFYDYGASYCITPMISNKVKYEGVIYEIPDNDEEWVSLGDGSIALSKYPHYDSNLMYITSLGIQDESDERLQNILFEVNTKLDEIFIPDTIARKSDIAIAIIENEEIVSSALNSLNTDIKQLYKIIEEGEGGVTIGAVSQVATDLYNFKNEVRTGITVHNSERIAGQTIDEIVSQLAGASGGLNPGYDSDSKAYIVGIDDDSNAYYSNVYMEGDTLNAPNGFFQQSDENLKTFMSNIEVDLEKIAQLPKKFFMWSDKRDENIHIGTSAQAVQELYPEIVKRDKNGNLTVDYSKLSVIALRAIDVLNEERKQMKADIAEIKNKLGL